MLDPAIISYHPKNRNKHPKRQIEMFAPIMKYQGWRLPIIVSNLSKFCVSGHGRLEVAKLLGLNSVPVVFQNFVDLDQEYAFMVSDNAIAAQAELDMSGINLDVPDLGPDFDIDLLGIDGFTIDRSEKGADGKHEDEAPEPPKIPITKTGDLIILGNHRLLCGDSTKREDVDRLMDGKKADMVFTSPPYNLGKSIKLSNNKSMSSKGNAYTKHDDGIDGSLWGKIMDGFFSIAMENSKYIFVNVQSLAGNKRELWRWLNEHSKYYCDVMIWDKGHAPPAAAPNVMNSRFEFIFIFTSEENPTRSIRIAPFFRGTIDNVLSFPPQRNNEFAEIHGATFPVVIPEHMAKSFCQMGGILFDPFIGTGTTMIACEKTGRICYGMEIDPTYCDVVVKRWADYTGNTEITRNGKREVVQ